MKKFKKLSLLLSSFAAVATLPMVAAACSKTEAKQDTPTPTPTPVDPKPEPNPEPNPVNPTPQPVKPSKTYTKDELNKLATAIVFNIQNHQEMGASAVTDEMLVSSVKFENSDVKVVIKSKEVKSTTLNIIYQVATADNSVVSDEAMQSITGFADAIMSAIRETFKSGKWFVTEISEAEYELFANAKNLRIDYDKGSWYVDKKSTKLNEFGLSEETLAIGEIVTNDIKKEEGKIGASLVQSESLLWGINGEAPKQTSINSLSPRLTYTVDKDAKTVSITTALYQITTNDKGEKGLVLIADTMEYVLRIKPTPELPKDETSEPEENKPNVDGDNSTGTEGETPVVPEPAPEPQPDPVDPAPVDPETGADSSTTTDENQPPVVGEEVVDPQPNGGEATGTEGGSTEDNNGSSETNPVVPGGENTDETATSEETNPPVNPGESETSGTETDGSTTTEENQPPVGGEEVVNPQPNGGETTGTEGGSAEENNGSSETNPPVNPGESETSGTDGTNTSTKETEEQPVVKENKEEKIIALFNEGKWFVPTVSQATFDKFSTAKNKRLDFKNGTWYVNKNGVAVEEFGLSEEALAFGDLVTNDIKGDKGKIGATLEQGKTLLWGEDGTAPKQNSMKSLSSRLTYTVDTSTNEIKIDAVLYKVTANEAGEEGLVKLSEKVSFRISVK